MIMHVGKNTGDLVLEELAKQVVDAAYQVHVHLGPGLLESVYETCLCHELGLRGIPFEQQKTLRVSYKGISVDQGLRLDIVVSEKLIVEIKAVEKVLPVHGAQLLTYLKLTGCKLGLLINFNVPLIRDGIQRIVSNQPSL